MNWLDQLSHMKKWQTKRMKELEDALVSQGRELEACMADLAEARMCVSRAAHPTRAPEVALGQTCPLLTSMCTPRLSAAPAMRRTIDHLNATVKHLKDDL